MDISIKDTGAFTSASVQLEPGERFVSEAGCFFHSTPNVEIDVTTRRKKGGKGGLMRGEVCLGLRACLGSGVARGIGLCGDWCIGHRVEDAFVSGLELALASLR